MARKSEARRRSAVRSVLARAVAPERLEGRVLLSTYVVTTTADAGDGSLRAAITAADTDPAATAVTFNIPGSGVHTIPLLSALPAVTRKIVIDGTTQPEYGGTPLIALDGAAAGSTSAVDGLVLAANGAGVQGPDVENFSGNGIDLIPATSTPTGGQFVRSCFIGTDPTGTLARGNGGYGLFASASAATLGGGAGQGNLISANRQSGIVALGRGAVISGNLVGTNAFGQAALGNGREGIDIAGFQFVLGGPNVDQGNVISGNASSGVFVVGGGGMIQGDNRIGTNAAGTAALANGWLPSAAGHDGITIAGVSQVSIIDAASAAAGTDNRNLISGNTAAGINDVSGFLVAVTGNYIGTDVTGTAALGNGTDGVDIPSIASGQSPMNISKNVISGNVGDGMRISGFSNLISVSSNRIGTNAAGDRAVPNGANGIEGSAMVGPANVISGNRGNGILGGGTIFQNLIGVDASGSAPLGNQGHGIDAFQGVTIGITETFKPNGQAVLNPAGNVISANGGDGILLQGGGGTIGANKIGTTADGSFVPGIGNGRDGIALYDSNQTAIGGLVDGASIPNFIAYNAHNGVTVVNTFLSVGPIHGNTISTNSIFSNGALGIDLGDDGVTPNAPPPTRPNPNGTQDFPVIASAVAQTGGSVITGTVAGPANTGIVIEAFDNDQPDPSGYGEGQRLIGSVTVTTDASGNASFTLTTTGAAPAGTFVTTTATAELPLPQGETINGSPAFGDTSEFSAAVQVQPAGATAPPAAPSDSSSAADPAVDSPDPYLVTTTADSGDGSLRSAIEAANAHNAVVHFDIPGPGVHTIFLLSPLPRITSIRPIDATTQPGYAGSPLVALDGTSAGPAANGLVFTQFTSGAKGLAIDNFSGSGIVISSLSSSTPGVTVTGCYIGVDPTGEHAAGNGGYGILDSGFASVFGGAGALGNVISGNRLSGVEERGGGAQIAGNRIGTDAAGNMAIPNGDEGIDADGACTIGGNTVGAGNVISANGSSGILAESGVVMIEGANRIGTNAAGTAALGNGSSPAARFHDGVTVFGGNVVISDLTVGTGASAIDARNVISGNSGDGVFATSRGSNDFVSIGGTYIGTDAKGSYALPNGRNGIDLMSVGGQIGGNLISGNRGDGILALGNARVGGNFIGTNAAGTAAIPNGGSGFEGQGTIGPANVISGNAGDGIVLTGGSTVFGNTVGLDANGDAPLGNAGNGVDIRSTNVSITNSNTNNVEFAGPSQPNVISGNAGSGVLVDGLYISSLTGRTSVQILGNLIGTDAAGISGTGFGNGRDGVTILSAVGITIGSPTQPNTIAGNAGNGVTVIPSLTAETIDNLISGNSIFSNARLGIDVGDDGVTPNRLPAPGQAIGLQTMNVPIITLADVTPNGTVIAGRVPGLSPQFQKQSIRIELFANDAADPSGFGEGRWYLGQITTLGDATGNAPFLFSTLPLPAGTVVTATATDNFSQSIGNTSEFSQAVAVQAPAMVVNTSFAMSNGVPTVSVQFDQNVSPLLTARSLTVTNGTSTFAATAVTYDPATNTATFTLPAALPPGSYRAVLGAGSLLGSLVNPQMPVTGYTFTFTNPVPTFAGQGVIGFADLLILAQHYNQPGTFADGDINNDGRVDFKDLLILAQNYGKSLRATTSGSTSA